MTRAVPRGGGNVTTIQARLIGEEAILAPADLERLLSLARRAEAVELQWHEDDWPAWGVMRLAEAGGASTSGGRRARTIYTTQDGKPL